MRLLAYHMTDLPQPFKGVISWIDTWIRLVPANLLDKRNHLTPIERRIRPRDDVRQQGIDSQASLEEVIHSRTPPSAYYLAGLGSDLHIYHQENSGSTLVTRPFSIQTALNVDGHQLTQVECVNLAA